MLRKGTLALKYVHGGENGKPNHYIEIAEDHSVAMIPVTSKMTGQTLKELDLRANFHVNVVSIKAKRYDHTFPDNDVPNPDQKLRKTDTLVVVGPESEINRMKEALS